MNQQLVADVCKLVFDGKSYSTLDKDNFLRSIIDQMISKGYEFQCDYDLEDQWQAYFYREYIGADSIDVKNCSTMLEAVSVAAINAIKNDKPLPTDGVIIIKNAALSEETIAKFKAEWDKVFPEADRLMGRWQSTEPNVQSLPKDSQIDPKVLKKFRELVPVRKDFKLEPGEKVVIGVDYLSGSLEPRTFDFGALEEKVMAMKSPFGNPMKYVASQDGRKFDPVRDLPDPSIGDVCQGADGSYWYALNTYEWAEFYCDYAGNPFPTGKVIDVRNRVLSQPQAQEKTVQNSAAKPSTCTNYWEHDWKKYTGLMETYEYCAKCDEKRN